MEQMKLGDRATAMVTRSGGQHEQCDLSGIYHVTCTDKDGNVKWTDTAHNLVTTAGRNALLDIALGASSCSVISFMGLISSVGWSAVAATDTMSSHPGWNEASASYAPTYTVGGSAVRATLTSNWAAASGGNKALTSSVTFVITQAAGGTVEGIFIVLGSTGTPDIDAANAATNTQGQGYGVLLSAGKFTQDARTVGADDNVIVSYTLNTSST